MKLVTRLTCCLLLMVFPATMVWADAQQIATLSGSGTVRVNGSVVPATYTIYSGDRVATAPQSAAVLTTRGATFTLQPDSSATYGEKQFTLERGQVLITSGQGREASLANLTVSPADGMTKFSMQSDDKGTRLSVLSGTLRVSDGHQAAMLAAGYSMTRTSEIAEGQAAGGSGGSGAAAGASPLSGWTVGLIAAGVMGVGVATALATSGSPTPLSPSKP